MTPKFSGRTAARLRFELLETRDNPATNLIASGAAAGGLPIVQLTRPDGSLVAQLQAFDSNFRGGVRAAAGELDGQPNTVEVVAAAGPGGGPHVRVYRVDLGTGTVSEVASFFAFEPTFRGGTRVAVGDVAGADGRQEIVVAADMGGGPRVRTLALDGSGGVAPVAGPLGDFFAFEPTFRGGVRLAAGELDGNLTDGDELLLAAGPGGGPRVRALRADGAEIANFFAFRPDFLGGVNVGVDSTGGTVGTPRLDALAADFSQRATALNTAAGVRVNTGTVGTGQTGTNGLGTGGGTGTSGVGINGGTNGQGTNGLTSGNVATGTSNPSISGGSSSGFGGLGVPSGGLGTTGGNSLGFGTGGFGGFGSSNTISSAPRGGSFRVDTGSASTGGLGGNNLGTSGVGSGINGFGTSGTGTNGFGTAGLNNGFNTTGFDGAFANPFRLTLDANRRPQAFTLSDGSSVFAPNAGVVTPFPTFLNPPFATGFTPGFNGGFGTGFSTGGATAFG